MIHVELRNVKTAATPPIVTDAAPVKVDPVIEMTPANSHEARANDTHRGMNRIGDPSIRPITLRA